MNSLKELAAFFDQQTYPVLYKNFLVEASFKEAEFVKQYIKANNRVLDLHCGEGRHIDLLSSSNIYLEALDAQKHFIENIKSRQPNIITYNMPSEELNFIERYDLVYCLGTSIGYRTKEIEKIILRKVFESLKSEGIFLLHIQNRHITYQYFTENAQWEDAEGDTVTEQRFQNKNVNSLVLEQIRKSNEHRKIELYLYPKEELVQIVEEIGFKIIEIFGDFNKETFSESSTDLILVLQK